MSETNNDDFTPKRIEDDEDGEFFDASDGIEKLNIANDDNKTDELLKPDESFESKVSPKLTSLTFFSFSIMFGEIKFVPLHDELNQKQAEANNLKDFEDEEEKEANVVAEEHDPYFIDEEVLKKNEETMSEEEKSV